MPHLRDGYEPVLNNVQVHVQSRLSASHAECITVDTSSSATVESVISSFCAQKGIRRNPYFALCNSNNKPLECSAVLEAEGITDGALLFLVNKKQIIMSQPRWGLLAFIAVVIGGGGLLSVILLFCLTGGDIPFDYAVVIDAGSSHSQVLLYQWSGQKDVGTAHISQRGTCSVDGGIATLKNPDDILSCVDSLVQSIPSASYSHSYLYLGATAGMRLLNMSSPRIAELIMIDLKCSLTKAGLEIKKIDIITGVEEAISGWITDNFILNTLHPKEGSEPWSSTFGSLDMGGASTQYAFAINPEHIVNSSNLVKIRLYGHDYGIVANSYLCFGFMEASRRHQVMLIKNLNDSMPIYDPCLPKGNTSSYTAQELLNPCTLTPKFNLWLSKDPRNKDKVFHFEGGSDYPNCSASVKKLLNSSLCEEMGFEECATSAPIFLIEKKFVAVSSFFYITSFFNSTNTTLEEFLTEVKNWCSTTWSEMADLPFPPGSEKRILLYCFGANYIIQWLTHMYGFNNNTWKNIIFENKVGKSDLGWALGFMVNASNALPEENPTPASLTSATFAILIIICALVICISIILLRKFVIERRQLADLEDHRRLLED